MDPHAAKRAYAYIADHAGHIRDVTVSYSDATVVSGFVRRVEKETINLCRHSAAHPQYFDIGFEHATKVKVTSHDGIVAVFED